MSNRDGLLVPRRRYSSLDEKMMRRQVKPFVTEYRGTPRRSKDLSLGSDPHQDGQPSRSRSYAEAQKVFHQEPPEDSYEAAMRAADALFSSERSEPSPRPMETSSAESAFRSFPVLSEEIDSDGAASTPSEKRPANAAPRRILQAIEPPQEDRFAALEAERAPKRRGRKPGSKNKPKSQVGDDWAATMPQTPSPTLLSRSSRSGVSAKPATAQPRFNLADFIDTQEDDHDVVDLQVAEVPEGAAPSVGTSRFNLPEEAKDFPPPPRGRTDKFGWKRNGLRPGERWKRRLPKSAR